MNLDAVIELKVNESVLLERVERRAAEARARGEEVRADDTAEVLTRRLSNYRDQTEPLIHYYSDRRKLATVDGMMSIEEVTEEIGRILTALDAPGAARPAKKAGTAKRSTGAKKAVKRAKKSIEAIRAKAPAAKKAGKKAGRTTAKKAVKTAKKAGKAAKSAKKAAKAGAKKAVGKSAAKAATKPKAKVAAKPSKGARKAAAKAGKKLGKRRARG
jgi:adenylate kinase